MTDTNARRTIKLTTVQGKRRPDKINTKGRIFSICTLKKVTIKPCESTQIDSQIGVELPDGLVRTLIVLPTIQMTELKLKNDNSVEGKQTLVFQVINQTFSNTFTFKRTM